MHAPLIHRLFHAIDHRDWRALGQLLAPDVVYQRPGYDPLRGRARVLDFYERERVVLSGAHCVERVVSDAEAAACWGSFVGVSRTGEPLAEHFADVYLIADDLVLLRRTHFFRAAI